MSANIVQTLNAVPWRGKRVRFRAAVRTRDLEASARAQLWFRVDLKSTNGRPAIGGFEGVDAAEVGGLADRATEVIADIQGREASGDRRRARCVRLSRVRAR